MLVFDCGFTEPSLILLLPGWELRCGICEIPGRISRQSIYSPNVVGAGAAALASALGLNDGRNPQSRCAVLLICFTEVVGCILPSHLCQFVQLHLLLPKPLHAMLCHFADCAHHPAGFVIFAQLALLCPFIILIFPILPIVRTCKITQTVSDSLHHLLKRLFGLCVR